MTIRQAKPISVKGYAEKAIISDVGSIRVTIKEKADDNASGFIAAGKQIEKVKNLIEEVLIEGYEIEDLNPRVEEIKYINSEGKKTNEIDYWEISRSVSVHSDNVEKIKLLGMRLQNLNAEGIRILVSGPDFHIKNLEEIKLSLIEEATKNGKRRAELMAKNSGEKLGSLISARQGVIQITRKNDSRTSSYGIYDTSTIDKVIKLVMTLEYEISR